VHFLQIWVLPENTGLAPGYEQKSVEAALGTGELVLIASRDGRAGSASLHQDADLYAARPSPGRELVHEFRPGRGGWLQVARGRVRANGESMAAGDGAAVTQSGRLSLVADGDAEVLLFDMA
jgi:redox-sensitive bicupin YhaK (pirin superfamily)